MDWKLQILMHLVAVDDKRADDETFDIYSRLFSSSHIRPYVRKEDRRSSMYAGSSIIVLIFTCPSFQIVHFLLHPFSVLSGCVLSLALLFALHSLVTVIPLRFYTRYCRSSFCAW